MAAIVLASLCLSQRLNAQNSLVVSPQSLLFTSQGGQAPPPQTFSVQSSTGVALNFTVSVEPPEARTWLSAAPLGINTPSTVMVFVSAGTLQPGTYNGTVRVTAPDAINSPFNVPVTLTIGGASQLVANPAQLAFSYVIGGSQPAPQNVTVTSASGAALSLTVSSSVSWLTFSATSGTTPFVFGVSVITTGLTPGNYNATITLTPPPGLSNNPLNVPVTLTVSSSSQLVASPAQLAFTYVSGGIQPMPQNVTVTTVSGTALNFTISTSTSWLTFSATSGTTPFVFSVGVNPAGLAVGTHNATIILTPQAGAGAALLVPVTLTVASTPTLTANPTSLSFYYQIGTTPFPAQRVISLTSPGAVISFNLSFSSTGNWLVVTPTGGFTPSDLAVGVAPAVVNNLPPNTYSGSIIISSAQASNSPLTVPVTLIVSTNPLITATPSSLSFDVQPGGTPPANKTFALASSGTQLGFTVSTAVTWLTLNPTAGTTPATITVGVAAPGMTLPPGQYTATIVISAPNAGNSPLNVPVTLNVSGTPVLVASPSSLFFNYQTTKSLPAAQTVSLTSTGAPINFTALASSTGNWLSISQTTGTAPVTLGVAANPGSLGVGSHQGTITVTPQVTGAIPLTLNVTLTISDNPLMNVSPNALSFTFAPGGPTTDVKTLGLTSTSDALNFTASWNVSSGPSTWLAVSPLGGTTPAILNVFANSTGLSPGTYTGTVTVSATGANSQTIPVTLTVGTGNNLAITPASLSFEQAQGGPAPAAKTLQVSTSGASLTFSATATSAIGTWLSVSPASGTTPATLNVSANGAGLSQGTYFGTVTVVALGAANSPQMVQVTLTVGPAQTIAVSSTSLSFSFQQGGNVPAAQRVNVTSTGGSLNFTTGFTSTGAWLSASPASGTTPGEVTVSVNPAGLAPGTHNGTVTIASPAASNSPQTVNVTLAVTGLVVGPVTGIVNAATLAPGPLAPGEIVTLFGVNIGPATAVGLRITPEGLVDTTLAETRVLFDGVRAPMIYASRTQVNCVAPYALAGRITTRVQVEFQGVRSEAIELRVAETAPGIFTLSASGSGQGAILNQNFTINGAGNPAAKGSVVMIYATGEGQTNPPGQDGVVTGGLLRRPLREVFATIGGRPAQVLYAGSAPGFVAGVLQVNAVVPEDIASGSAPVVLTIGGISSSTTVTLAVR